MGWSFPWVSSFHNDFNRDFNVTFTDEELADPSTIYNYESRPYPITEMPGISVFTKDDAHIYHTYSTYGRGLDTFLGVYHFLDITPKGRDENGQGMAWVRHHDRYENGGFVQSTGRFVAKADSSCRCDSEQVNNTGRK